MPQCRTEEQPYDVSACPQPLGRCPGWGGKALAVPLPQRVTARRWREGEPLLQEGQFPMHRVRHGQVLLPVCPATGSAAGCQPCRLRADTGPGQPGLGWQGMPWPRG